MRLMRLSTQSCRAVIARAIIRGAPHWFKLSIRIAFVDRFWLTAVSLRQSQTQEWNAERPREAFVRGLLGVC